MGAGSSTRKRVAPDAEALSSQLSEIRSQLEEAQLLAKSTNSEMVTLKAQVKSIASHITEFRVAQYNILAGYLGDNRQPWFLYGPTISNERREAIMKKFYYKGPDGKFANEGWPKYVDGILTEAEQTTIVTMHEQHFTWERRRDRLLDVIAGWSADLISLVECDHYDDFFRPEMEARGYGCVYKQRPRPSSEDGSAIFFRTAVFRLVASTDMEFVDKFDPASGKTYKDRVCAMALLEHCSGRRIVFISTHLARNPEDPKQTKSRAKQTAQLLKGLTDFAHAHDALDAPALMAGDLNTTNIRQIADIARTVFELCQQTAHPFLFTATPPRSLPTSVTTTRRMCIDYLFMQSSLVVVDQDPMESLFMETPIPNAQHPSDHLPLVFKLAFRDNVTQLNTLASIWIDIILASDGARSIKVNSQQPLPRADIHRAFAFFDVYGDGALCPVDFETGLKDLGMDTSYKHALLERLAALLPPGRKPLTPDDPLEMSEFQQAYLNGFLVQKHSFANSMRDAFAYFDSSGDGRLDHDELFQSFVDACPFEVDKAAFSLIFQKIDANGDGHVTIDEFINYLLKSQISS